MVGIEAACFSQGHASPPSLKKNRPSHSSLTGPLQLVYQLDFLEKTWKNGSGKCLCWFVCLGHASYDSPVIKTDVPRVVNPAVLPLSGGGQV